MNPKRTAIIIFIFTATVVLLLQRNSDRSRVIPCDQPGRIVSLSPSVTRDIIDLGARDSLAGVTDYTLHTELPVESVGTYMSPNFEKIIRLRPDLVIISEEDSAIQKVPLLEHFGIRIETMRRNTGFSSMCSNYMRLAELLGMAGKAEKKLEVYRERIESIEKPETPPGIVFLVSVNPLVTVSGGSHISSIIRDAGGINVYEHGDTPYPVLSLESLILSGADALILMNRSYESRIYSLLSGYRNIRFITNGNIFITGEENIPYYTPGDYTISVEKIAAFIKMIKR